MDKRISLIIMVGCLVGVALGFAALPSQAAPLLAPGEPVLEPISNTHTASLTAAVVITYNETINPTTVSTQTLAVYAMQTGLLPGSYSVDGGAIRLAPPQPFKPGELVQVSATTGTLNLGGQGPISPTVWQFRAEATGGHRFFIKGPAFADSRPTWNLALGDLDGDGDLDAFVGNGGTSAANQVWFNGGDGAFTNSGQALGNANSEGVALGDLDGDGDLDAFIANAGYQPNKVWLNDGDGLFSQEQQLGSSYSVAAALGDVDGDGDLDALVGNWEGGDNELWLNDGRGHFTDSGQSLTAAGTHAVALTDLDGDGDLDAFVANTAGSNEANTVWLNDGRGRFSDTGQRLGSRSSNGLALGDLDGDGDLDAFVANWNSQANRVWLNDGRAVFSVTSQSLGAANTWGVALGDLDGDGDLDAFAANSDDQPNRLWLNDGLGVFTVSERSLGNADSRNVALGDLDGDGDLDALVGNWSYQNNQIWLNVPPPCQLQNLALSPAYPADSDDLALSFSCDSNAYTRWKRNGVLQTNYNKLTTIPHTATQPGEQWCVTVQPYQGDATGDLAGPLCVTILEDAAANIPPEARQPTLSPAAPLDSDTLSLAYTYYDDDGDPEAQSQLRWYRDDTLQPAFNNQTTVAAAETFLGETWCATVRPDDGLDYGPVSESNCVVIGSGNQPPQVLTPTLSPVEPTGEDALSLIYQFYDPEGASELVGGRQVRWYRNGDFQPALTNTLLVPASATIPGDSWQATLRVSDGQNDSLLAQTEPVLIVEGQTNTPPALANVRLAAATSNDATGLSLAAAIGDDDDLLLTYDFLDVDGDPDQTSKIFWFRWNRTMETFEHQPAFDGQKRVPAAMTATGDTWYVIVIPSDGQAEGETYYTHSITIGQIEQNNPPEAVNVYLSPNRPGPVDPLRLHYRYTDPESDPEGDSQVQWQRDGHPQSALADRTVIPAGETFGGEAWCAIVTPHDGQSAGEPVPSNCVTILNTGANSPPLAREAHIEPGRPASDQDLRLRYTYVDTDDMESEYQTRLRWYKDGQLQPAYSGLTDIPATATAPGQVWRAEVRPHDGQTYGDLVETEPITINTPPRYASLYINPVQPKVYQPLTLSYGQYSDADNDPESPTSPRIHWYRDDTHLPELDGQRSLSGRVVTPAGSIWYATLTPHDGIEYGPVLTASAVTLLATVDPKIPSEVYLPIIARFNPDTPSPSERCSPDTFYEDNDSRAQACLLLPGQSYTARPDDIEDVFYFVLTETTSVLILVEDYQATEPGQLLLYDSYDNTHSIAAERYLIGAGTIPNNRYPYGGRDLVGKFYVRIYTYDGSFRPDTSYQLRLLPTD